MIQVDRKSKENLLHNPDAEQQEQESHQLFQHSYLTVDHNLSLQKEARRIIKHGGDIRPYPLSKSPRGSSSERVVGSNGALNRVWMQGKDYPGLAVSRSIGDQIAHNIGVSIEPGKREFLNYKQTSKKYKWTGKGFNIYSQSGLMVSGML